MRKLLVLLALFFTSQLYAQDKPAYVLYSKKGKKVKYTKMLKDIVAHEVLLFGEIHNIPICHWLQLEVTREMYSQKGGQIVLGAEMFERDNQLLIDEYFSGTINQNYFEDETRLWSNYATDYKPLLEFAKTNNVPFIATNIPRRYASTVFKQGIETLNNLSEEAKRYIAPLPIEVDLELKSYKSMMDMMGGHSDANANFPKAQAIKDATMAWFISQNQKPGHLFIHYNGSFHSDDFEGINWYLKKYQPQVKIVTIATVTQEDIDQLAEENLNKADYIICIPENMCRTH